ncbi:MAG: hypothetical protein ALECFALPRED_011082 [Alectoria fallacina]|uniref:Pentatricopeptide repeat-containing protein n=1 Tax=Alectoria fallacina TaxID=1903189 RepID=A0A8H3F7Z7_9LECA|nr:MAG: hypothetical protein ALECFALPRED_011082 [Alectoria fallacina]
MYARGYMYGRISRVACSPTITRHGITSRPPNAPEPQQAPVRRNHFAYQWISHRPLHTAEVEEEEEEEDKKQQDIEAGHTIRRVESNNPSTTPSLRFITFDQAQHDMGVESREMWERERYSDQIARFLPIQLASQPKDKRSQKSSYGKNKEDKLFVNTLLKDKGLSSNDWRIALSDLRKHYTPNKTDKRKEIITCDHALSLVQTTGSHAQDLDGSNEMQSSARRVSSTSRNHRSFGLARSILPPIEWSEVNLAIYVEALADSQKNQAKIPWTEKPRLKGWTNIGDVVAIFDSVFYSMALQKSLSIEACNTALRFFYDHGMMAKARFLYIRMEDLKMQIPTETFNILLRGSASQRDLHNFTFLLNNMTRRGFKPNEETWVLFLQVIDTSTVRAIIVRKMAEMNMLDGIGIRRDVAAHMVHYEIVNHLDDGHDPHSFLEHMNSKYGIGWLSTTAGNKLLNEVAKRKSAAESLSLLYEMKQAGFMPDDISMNTLLRHCLPLKGHELAIEILNVFKYHYRLQPGPQAYETLFIQAWRSRLLNFSKVIWRSACIYGTVSPKIQHLVFQSLLSYTTTLGKRVQSDDTAEPSSPSRYAKFKKFAGRFVIGVDGPRGAELNQAKDTLELNPRRRTLKWAQILVESSLRVARTCRLKNDLPQLLHQALTTDKTWAAEGLNEKDDWQEMFPHAIVVDVEVIERRRRRFPLRLRKLMIRARIATRQLTRNRHSLRGPNYQGSPRLSADQQTAKSIRKVKSLRKVRGRIVTRQLTRNRHSLRDQNYQGSLQLSADQQTIKSIRKVKSIRNVKSLRKFDPLRLRKYMIRDRIITRQLTRNRHPLRGSNYQGSTQSSAGQQTAKSIRKVKSLRKFGPPVRKVIYFIPFRYIFESHERRRRNFIRRVAVVPAASSAISPPLLPVRIPFRYIFESRERRRRTFIRRVTVVPAASSAISPPLLPVRNRNQERPKIPCPPQFKDLALVSPVASSERGVRHEDV